MDYISNKSLIESLLRSALTQTQPQSSNKNNIVLMNPEIHLHNNNDGSTSDGSMNNDVLLKKLQDELLHERQKREDEERRRHDENMKNEKILREKDIQIKNQNELISRQIKMLNEQRECLEKVYEYGTIEQRTRTEPVPSTNDFRQRNQWRTSKLKNRPNRSFTNVITKKKGQNQRDHRKRSKTTEPMDLWEWNGMKWVIKMPNGLLHNKEFNNQQKSQNSIFQTQPEADLMRDLNEGQINCASLTDKASAQSTHGINGTSQNNVPSSKPCKRPTRGSSNTIQKEGNESFHLNDTNFTSDEITFPTNISISFDDNEIMELRLNNENLYPVPKRKRQ